MLADSSKFEQAGIASFGKIENISVLITDDGVPKNIVKRIKAKGVKVIVAS